MRAPHYILATGGLITLLAAAADTSAQQVTIATPYRQLNNSFFEQNSINWSGNWRGINFSYGGGALAKPQFGHPDPSAGLSANWAVVGPQGRINFATNFSQGNVQSATSQTPSVTIMNGQQGFFSDTSQTPFVIGQIPVVGAFPMMPQQMVDAPGMAPMIGNPRVQGMLQGHGGFQDPGQPAPAPAPPAPAPRQGMKLMNVADPLPNRAHKAPVADKADKAEQVPDLANRAVRLNAAQESSAGRAAPSVAEARRMHQQEQGGDNGEEMLALMERARAAEEDGKPGVAKIYYQRVARHASGDVKQQALGRLDALRGTAPQ